MGPALLPAPIYHRNGHYYYSMPIRPPPAPPLHIHISYYCDVTTFILLLFPTVMSLHFSRSEASFNVTAMSNQLFILFRAAILPQLLFLPLYSILNHRAY